MQSGHMEWLNFARKSGSS